MLAKGLLCVFGLDEEKGATELSYIPSTVIEEAVVLNRALSCCRTFLKARRAVVV